MTQKLSTESGPRPPNEPDGSAGATVPRRVFGVLRLGVAILLIVSLLTQVIDELLHDAFMPDEYFSFFTVQSTLINAVVLFIGGGYALRLRRDSEPFTAVRMAALAYAVVTGVVYAALLRGVPTGGYSGIAWPNEALHVWGPIFIGLDWLFAPGRAHLAWKRIWFATIFPVAWLAFTLVRGPFIDWYPYPFLDPAGPAGWSGVVGYIAGIAVFIVVVACAAIAAHRVAVRRRAGPRLREDSGARRPGVTRRSR